MSSSIQLAEMVDNKVWTRCIMSEVGLGFPGKAASKHHISYKSKKSFIQNANIYLNFSICIDNHERYPVVHSGTQDYFEIFDVG